ncbi:MAG: hypothetical protein AB7O80_12850 [Acetobacteraceae bacterium]
MGSCVTITVAADDRSLLTLDELRGAVGIEAGKDDAGLRRIGDRVAAAFASVCGVRAVPPVPPTFRAESLSEQLDLECGFERIYLARLPVTSIASITENGTVLAAEDWQLEPGTGRLERRVGGRLSTWRPGVVTVVYQAGWAIVPDDLKLAAEMMAGLLWSGSSSAGRDPYLKRERIEGATELEYWVPPGSDPLLIAKISDLLVPYTVASWG